MQKPENRRMCAALLLLAFFVFTSSFVAATTNPFKDMEFRLLDQAEQALAFSQMQLEKMVELIDDGSRFPNETNADGEWNFVGARSWVSGFFPGCLWYMYEYTGDEKWRTYGDRWLTGLEALKTFTGHHDLGFMVHNSYGNAYRITGEEKYREFVIETSESLMKRFNHGIGCIRSWGRVDDTSQFVVIVDNMMNLEMLLWAADNGGCTTWHHAARSHADVSADIFIRDDGGTYHVVHFDPFSNAITHLRQHQGHSVDSTWARGQAWAIYGYTVMYRKTGDSRYLQTAEKLISYYLANLPEDYIPYWDFDAGRILPDQKRDSSAATITASALLELSTLVDCASKRMRYFKAAERMLESLCAAPYLAVDSDSQAIVLKSVHSKRDARLPEVKSHIWNEYYFIESLLRYKNLYEKGAIK